MCDNLILYFIINFIISLLTHRNLLKINNKDFLNSMFITLNFKQCFILKKILINIV